MKYYLYAIILMPEIRWNEHVCKKTQTPINRVYEPSAAKRANMEFHPTL